MSNTNTKTAFRQVTIPEMVVDRGEDGADTISGAVVAVPFSTSNLDAIEKALALHRESYGIPANITIRPEVHTVPLMVGTTVSSASNAARFHGKVVK